jgi:ubiquitin-conjugating enzyme E2 J2
MPKDSPYHGGFYHGKLLLPKEYPLKPPNVMFITPNGRFKPGEKICMSFTSYHPESWSIAWGIEQMLIALVSFMNSTERTTGSIETSSRYYYIEL